jgi:hypothetical protein
LVSIDERGVLANSSLEPVGGDEQNAAESIEALRQCHGNKVAAKLALPDRLTRVGAGRRQRRTATPVRVDQPEHLPGPSPDPPRHAL